MQQNSFTSYADLSGFCVKRAASATPKDGIWTGLLSFSSDTAWKGQMGERMNKRLYIWSSICPSHTMLWTPLILTKVGVMMHPTTAHWHFHIPLIMSELMVKEHISGDVDKMTHSHHENKQTTTVLWVMPAFVTVLLFSKCVTRKKQNLCRQHLIRYG